MNIVKMNKKQTKMKLEDGSRFKAVESPSVSCRYCYFDDLYRTCPSYGPDGIYMCTHDIRKDESNIIWVPRKEKRDGA